MARRMRRATGGVAGGGVEPVARGGRAKAVWAALGLAAGLIVATWVALDRTRGRTPTEGDGSIGGAIRSVARGVKDTATTVHEGVSGVQTSARNLGLEQQIVSRLRGDKAVDSGRIEVSIEGEGTAVLDGLVPDEAARERAVGLARNTRGVLEVVDRLAVITTPGGPVAVEGAATADAGAGGPRR